MLRSPFSEEQIISMLKEHEAGMKTAEMCRKHGVSDATLYKWKARYGCMTAFRDSAALHARGGKPAAEEAAGGTDARQCSAEGSARKNSARLRRGSQR